MCCHNPLQFGETCGEHEICCDILRSADSLCDWGPGAEWTVLPDVVAGGLDSLAFSLTWLSRIGGLRLLAVQDGMTPDDVRPYLRPSVGLFLGGTTEWKLATMYEWGRLAAQAGCHYHVARVNTHRRIRMCAAAGAHSFDGTSASRFSVNAGPLAEVARAEASQLGLFPRGT